MLPDIHGIDMSWYVAVIFFYVCQLVINCGLESIEKGQNYVTIYPPRCKNIKPRHIVGHLCIAGSLAEKIFT